MKAFTQALELHELLDSIHPRFMMHCIFSSINYSRCWNCCEASHMQMWHRMWEKKICAILCMNFFCIFWVQWTRKAKVCSIVQAASGSYFATNSSPNCERNSFLFNIDAVRKFNVCAIHKNPFHLTALFLLNYFSIVWNETNSRSVKKNWKFSQLNSSTKLLLKILFSSQEWRDCELVKLLHNKSCMSACAYKFSIIY